MEFDGSEEEAVRLSNATDYGLSACVYSGDLPKTAPQPGPMGRNGTQWDAMGPFAWEMAPSELNALLKPMFPSFLC